LQSAGGENAFGVELLLQLLLNALLYRIKRGAHTGGLVE
jgi:hypothetical protein